MPRGEPMEAKLALARAIVARSHGEEAAAEAEEHFTRVVREGQAPEEVPELPLPDGDPVHLPALLASAFGLSTSEARRLIGQGGVKVDGAAVTELDVPRAGLVDTTLQAGKRRFARLRATCLTATSSSATIPRPPERVGVSKVPSSTQPERFKHSIGYDQHRKLVGLWRESEAFLRRHPSTWHWSLKTQQRAFTSRPHGLAGSAFRAGLRVA